MQHGDLIPLGGLDFARMEYLRALLIESMGLFWLFAEVTILCAVSVARRHIENGANEAARELFARFLQRWMVWTLCFLALAMLVYGRHLLIAPAHLLLARPAAAPAELQQLFLRRGHEHLAVWSAFIAAWVVLEVLIVYQGWRGFQALSRRFGEGTR